MSDTLKDASWGVTIGECVPHPKVCRGNACLHDGQFLTTHALELKIDIPKMTFVVQFGPSIVMYKQNLDKRHFLLNLIKHLRILLCLKSTWTVRKDI